MRERRARPDAPRRAVLLLTLALGGCVPGPQAPPEPISGDPIARYRSSLAQREARSAAVESDVAIWVRMEGRRAIPGAQGGLLLAAPDAFRLRIASVFGTALDVGASGDSVTLYLPGRRAFARLERAADSLGIVDAGGMALRLWSGAWRAPENAFADGETEGGRRVARWREGDDSLALAVDPNGLPAWARLARRDVAWRIEYREWGGWDGVKWPARIDAADAGGRMRLTARVQRVRFAAHPDPLRIRVRPPKDAARLFWTELRREIEDLLAL